MQSAKADCGGSPTLGTRFKHAQKQPPLLRYIFILPQKPAKVNQTSQGFGVLVLLLGDADFIVENYPIHTHRRKCDNHDHNRVKNDGGAQVRDVERGRNRENFRNAEQPRVRGGRREREGRDVRNDEKRIRGVIHDEEGQSVAHKEEAAPQKVNSGGEEDDICQNKHKPARRDVGHELRNAEDCGHHRGEENA